MCLSTTPKTPKILIAASLSVRSVAERYGEPQAFMDGADAALMFVQLGLQKQTTTVVAQTEIDSLKSTHAVELRMKDNEIEHVKEKTAAEIRAKQRELDEVSRNRTNITIEKNRQIDALLRKLEEEKQKTAKARGEVVELQQKLKEANRELRQLRHEKLKAEDRERSKRYHEQQQQQ
jgi:hypothetical protein